jgi:hypothetical protein
LYIDLIQVNTARSNKFFLKGRFSLHVIQIVYQNFQQFVLMFDRQFGTLKGIGDSGFLYQVGPQA